MKKATEPMIEYAKVIASFLNISEPNYNNMTETNKFLALNVPVYKSEVKKKETSPIDLMITSKAVRDLNLQVSKTCEMLLNGLKDKHGIYFLFCEERLIYIGKSVNLSNRIPGSVRERTTKNCIIDSFAYLETKTKSDMHVLEIILISQLKPICNSDTKEDDELTILNYKQYVKALKKYFIFSDAKPKKVIL